MGEQGLHGTRPPSHHLEDECFGVEVVTNTERDWEVIVLECVRLHARDDAVEGEEGRAELGPRDAHGVEGVNVQDVDA